MRTVIQAIEGANFTLPGAVWEKIADAFVSQRFARGAVLVQQGDVSDKLYLVETGLIRGYYEWQAKEYTSWFAYDKQFGLSARSFFRQAPSFETVQVIEPSVISCVRYEDIQQSLTTLPEVEHLMRVLTEQFLLQYESRTRVLRGLSARQRLEHFVNHYPELYRRAPLQHIASYLDMTPATLSHLRAKKH